VWTKAEEHVVKIEKEYCIDRSVIEPIIIDFYDDVKDSSCFVLRQVVLCIIYVL
jgi:hypothetical protein